MKKKLGNLMMTAAGTIAFAPGRAITALFPDHGAGGPAMTVIALGIGAALTSPITLPMFVIGALIHGKR